MGEEGEKEEEGEGRPSRERGGHGVRPGREAGKECQDRCCFWQSVRERAALHFETIYLSRCTITVYMTGNVLDLVSHK